MIVTEKQKRVKEQKLSMLLSDWLFVRSAVVALSSCPHLVQLNEAA